MLHAIILPPHAEVPMTAGRWIIGDLHDIACDVELPSDHAGSAFVIVDNGRIVGISATSRDMEGGRSVAMIDDESDGHHDKVAVTVTSDGTMTMMISPGVKSFFDDAPTPFQQLHVLHGSKEIIRLC